MREAKEHEAVRACPGKELTEHPASERKMRSDAGWTAKDEANFGRTKSDGKNGHQSHGIALITPEKVAGSDPHAAIGLIPEWKLVDRSVGFAKDIVPTRQILLGEFGPCDRSRRSSRSDLDGGNPGSQTHFERPSLGRISAGEDRFTEEGVFGAAASGFACWGSSQKARNSA